MGRRENARCRRFEVRQDMRRCRPQMFSAFLPLVLYLLNNDWACCPCCVPKASRAKQEVRSASCQEVRNMSFTSSACSTLKKDENRSINKGYIEKKNDNGPCGEVTRGDLHELGFQFSLPNRKGWSSKSAFFLAGGYEQRANHRA